MATNNVESNYDVFKTILSNPNSKTKKKDFSIPEKTNKTEEIGNDPVSYDDSIFQTTKKKPKVLKSVYFDHEDFELIELAAEKSKITSSEVVSRIVKRFFGKK